MGFYETTIFPWLNERMNRDAEIVRLRKETLAAARGRVLEIGFGPASNLPHYPATVTELVAIEPNRGMSARAGRAIARARFPVDVVAGGAESLPFEDRSFDTAVSTLVLCTVSDPVRVLAEIRRVLRSDGRLLVLEHGLSEDAGVARWQHRLNRIQNVVACGCNLDRDIGRLITAAGFRFDDVHNFYSPRLPRTHGWMTQGTARVT